MSKAPRSKKSYAKSKKYVPYARGFCPPLPGESKRAIGLTTSKEYTDHKDPEMQFFKSISQPSSIDDWLAQYVEEGQTYSQFKKENPWFSRRKAKYMRQVFVPAGNTIQEKYPSGKIYIAKIGNFSSSATENVNFDDLLNYVRKFLCLPVEVLEGLDIEKRDGEMFFINDPTRNPSGRPVARIRKSYLHTRENAKPNHLQIRIDSVLPKIQGIIPDDALCLIVLTNYDLYESEEDLFVAGMAAGLHRVAIFSLYRYNPTLTFSKEFWYDIKPTKKVTDDEFKRLMLQRSCKLVVHELCHLLGIAHCIYYNCCMNGSGHLEEDFIQPMMLCPVDLHKLQSLIGFNVEERYRNLLEFYSKHGMDDEADWTRRRLEFLSLETS